VARKNDQQEHTGSLGFEDKLWAATDLLRNDRDPAEYQHVGLGLLFLEDSEDAVEERRAAITAAVSDPKSSDSLASPKKREAERRRKCVRHLSTRGTIVPGLIDMHLHLAADALAPVLPWGVTTLAHPAAVVHP
jgi:hypothetical protein